MGYRTPDGASRTSPPTERSPANRRGRPPGRPAHGYRTSSAAARQIETSLPERALGYRTPGTVILSLRRRILKGKDPSVAPLPQDDILLCHSERKRRIFLNILPSLRSLRMTADDVILSVSEESFVRILPSLRSLRMTRGVRLCLSQWVAQRPAIRSLPCVKGGGSRRLTEGL